MKNKVASITNNLLLVIKISAMIAPCLANQKKRDPIIGILGQYSKDLLGKYIPNSNSTSAFISKSYVTWVSQAGAIPLIIPYNYPKKLVEKVLEDVDLVLLPGGANLLADLNLHPTLYQEIGELAIKTSIRKFDEEGIIYPVIATCLGFQQVAIYFSGHKVSVIKGWKKGESGGQTLDLEPDFWNSRIYKNFDKTLVEDVASLGNVYFSHKYSVLFEAYQKYLSDQFLLTSTSRAKNPQHERFVSSMEHVKYPIFGTQYHPEKNQYERKPGNMTKLRRDMKTMQFMRDYIIDIVSMARPFSEKRKNVPKYLNAFFATNSGDTFAYPGWVYERVYLFHNLIFQSILN